MGSLGNCVKVLPFEIRICLSLTFCLFPFLFCSDFLLFIHRVCLICSCFPGPLKCILTVFELWFLKLEFIAINVPRGDFLSLPSLFVVISTKGKWSVMLTGEPRAVHHSSKSGQELKQEGTLEEELIHSPWRSAAYWLSPYGLLSPHCYRT